MSESLTVVAGLTVGHWTDIVVREATSLGRVPAACDLIADGPSGAPAEASS